ncbi:MAG: tetratricopeptide repeat protein [Thermoplasmata archaeon]
MSGKCIKCDEEIDDFFLICSDCARGLFSDNMFWIAASPVIGPPVIDRCKEDSEPTLTIGERPGDELQFRGGKKTLAEVKELMEKRGSSYSEENIFQRYDRILVEMGVPKHIDFDHYIYSRESVRVFTEIFFAVEEIREDNNASLYAPGLFLRLGNLLHYTSKKTDDSAFEPKFRHKAVDDLVEEAKSYYEIAEKLSEKPDIHGYNNLGKLHLDNGEYESAKDNFQRALRIDKDNFDTRIGLTKSLIGQEQPEEAERVVDQMLKKFSDKPDVWYLKGDISFVKDVWGGAIQFYNQALSKDDTFHKARMAKAKVFHEKGMLQEANDELDDLIEKDESNAEAWYMKADILDRMEKWGGAIQCLTQALSLDPQMIRAWDLQGDILVEQEQFEEAFEAYNTSLKIYPNREEIVKKKKECEEMMDQ